MFVMAGKDLMYLVTWRIPEVVEKVMQKGHSKWCDSARIVPWSAGEEVGATLRFSIKRGSKGDFALSWGAAYDEHSKVSLTLYDGDVAGLLYDAVFGPGGPDRADNAKIDLDGTVKGRVECVAVKDLVSRIVEKIRNVAVAHKMMEGA